MAESKESSSVVVVGSLMTDLIVYAQRLPTVGETLMGENFMTSFGGKGANQAVQCARLGTKVYLIGSIGDDSFGEAYLKHLSEENIDQDQIMKCTQRSTGTALIQVDSLGQNTIVIVPGANLDIHADDVLAILPTIPGVKVLLCQNEINRNATVAALKYCREHDIFSILNTAPGESSLLDLISLCDVACPNEVELRILTGMPTNSHSEIEAAARVLLSKGCKFVLVTLGAQGACLVRPDSIRFFPAPIVTAIDTVGAGDSFLGALAASLAKSMSIETAIQNAILCASISVTVKGAQIANPRQSEMILVEGYEH